jgi:hypothetical protein
MRRWLTGTLAEYRRHPRWAAAGLAVVAIALAAAGVTWIMRQLATPPADAPAGIASRAPGVHHPPASRRTPPRPGPAPSLPGRALQLRPGAPGPLAGHAVGLARFRAAQLPAALGPGPGQLTRFAGAGGVALGHPGDAPGRGQPAGALRSPPALRRA